MKKLVVILMAVVMVVIGIMVMTNDNAKAERIEGAVYGKYGSEVMDWLEEWVNAVGDGRHHNSLDENGYFKGYGVIDGNYFEKEYGKELNIENMYEIYEDIYGDDLGVDIVCAGFYDDYAVYKISATSDTISIGSYDGTEYYKGDMYFMVCFEE